jgi:ABC-type Fe3+/spermidine/putrescine transport system ATPase subunit
LGALDRKLRAEMQMEIRAIQREVRITTLYVTHDQEEALTISDRIGVMHEGRLVQIGRPMEMYDRPVDIFVADFLGEANILHGRIVEGSAHAMTIDSGGLRVSVEHGAKSHAAGDEAVVAIRPERIRLATGRDSWQHAEGVIEQVLYLGNQFRMVVNVRGQRITALMGRDEVAAVPENGTRVTLEWSPAAPILLRSSQPEPR